MLEKSLKYLEAPFRLIFPLLSYFACCCGLDSLGSAFCDGFSMQNVKECPCDHHLWKEGERSRFGQRKELRCNAV